MSNIELVDSPWTRMLVAFAKEYGVDWTCVLSTASIEQNGIYLDIRLNAVHNSVLAKLKAYALQKQPLAFPTVFIDGVRSIYFIPTLVGDSYVLRTKPTPSATQTRPIYNKTTKLRGLVVIS